MLVGERRRGLSPPSSCGWRGRRNGVEEDLLHVRAVGELLGIVRLRLLLQCVVLGHLVADVVIQGDPVGVGEPGVVEQGVLSCSTISASLANFGSLAIAEPAAVGGASGIPSPPNAARSSFTWWS